MSLRHAFADEAFFASQLTRLVTDGSSDGFLNVSCGPDYFMQFVRNKTAYMRTANIPMPDHVFWNVVSNEMLPDNRLLNDLQIAQLRRLSFVYPCSPHPVYQFYSTGFVQVIEHPDERDVQSMAHCGCDIFANVFRCQQPYRLRFELRLRGYR
jgi:hypothetical protein